MGLDTMSAIKKAELVVADFSSNSGYLTVEQFREFIKIPVVASLLLSLVRIQEMAAPTMELPKISAMGQILHGSSSGQALTAGQRSKPAILPKVLLTSHLLRGAVPVPDEVLEDNVERDALNTTIRDLIGEAVSTDIERVVVLGDTTSASDLLNVTDGLIKRVTSNLVNAGTVYPTKAVFRDTDLSLPNAFRQTTNLMKFLTSHKAAIWYRDSVSNRTGELGDKALTQGDTGSGYAMYNGVPILPIPLFPENLGVGTNETDIIYGNPKDIIVGFQRNVRFEQERDAASGSTIFHVSLRMDVQLTHEQKFVKTTGVKVV